ncbi:hypothetical protein [Streptomyces sp. NPDC057494]|uniref:hypothetical protein n=1 Tax=Streptomyces sp. NPDC057494 TaxID=3346148 RepID=UPI0036BD238B
MGGLWKYFEENNEIFAALVAVLAIGGGLVGSIIGAKIQANGGRDQAAAAREAAEIAAEAQRVAALWTVRQVQVAEFIRSVREVVWTSNRLVQALDPDSLTQAETARQAMGLRVAEIELVVPLSVLAKAYGTYASAVEYWELAWGKAPVVSAERALHRLVRSSDLETASAAVAAARLLLDDDASGTDLWSALAAVPGLPSEQVTLLTERRGDTGHSIARQRQEATRLLDERTTELVEAAREMLKSEDDVASAVPQQRRRWWRRATPVTPAAGGVGSA